MAQKVSFDAYLGWVNITNPNQIPADARVIGANDLLRYEKLGQDTAKKFVEVDQTLEGMKSDNVVADMIADPNSETRYTVESMVKGGVAKFQEVIDKVPAQVEAQVTPLVTKTIASDGTIRAAAQIAVSAEVSKAGVVTGQVNADPLPATDSFRGGFIGENGRPTDLVFDKNGAVPESVITDWAVRLAPKVGGVDKVKGYSSKAAGGLVGENGRETDLIIDQDGKIVQHVIVDWAKRLKPILNGTAEVEPVPTTSKRDPRFGLGRNLRVRDTNGNLRYQTSRSDQFAAWGDSLTDGYPKPPFAANQSDSWPGVLASLLGKPVYNGGIQGQSADEIALRAGGLVPYFLPEGGAIPASGAVTLTTPDQIIGWRTDRGFSDVGSLAGIPGKISRVGSGSMMFTRTTAGSSVPVTSAQPWQSAGTQYSDATAILMLGRNDVGWASAGTQPLDRIVAANVAIIESLTPINPRFLILGTINSTGEYRNSSGWQLVTEANRILFEMYPENFLDIRSYLINQSIYDQKLTPTADDLNRIQNDAPPVQIMHDGVHYSVATAATIAKRIHTELKLKGWAA